MSKLKPFVNQNEEITGYTFNCPGCKDWHSVFVKPYTSHNAASWDFNGDLEKPTFSPSILTRFTKTLTDEQHALIMAGGYVKPVDMVCHSFVRDGFIQFLNDCTHSLAGKTVELLDVE